MEDKILVEICVGTYSYVMGGAELVHLENRLPMRLVDKIQTKGVVEMQGVDEATMKPPYVAINGKLMTEANLVKIIAAIDEELLQ